MLAQPILIQNSAGMVGEAVNYTSDKCFCVTIRQPRSKMDVIRRLNDYDAHICISYILKVLCVACAIITNFMLGSAKATDSRNDMSAGPAGPVGLPRGPYNQQAWWIPVQSSNERVFLEAAVYKPQGTGPFPLVIISHGKPTPGSDTRAMPPGFEEAAHWFVDRGFVVAVLLRRGYGHSEGAVADMVGSCANMDYLATAEQTAVDIEGAIEFLTKQSNIADQVVLVGHSHGAFGSLGVAAHPPKSVVGVVDFAGGTGNWGAYDFWQRLRRIVQGKLCNGRQHLLSALSQLGQRNSLPQIWLYAQNDQTFDPELAQAMYAAYQEKSRLPVKFVSLPAFGENGHSLLPDGPATSWAAEVNGFLKSLNIHGYLALD